MTSPLVIASCPTCGTDSHLPVGALLVSIVPGLLQGASPDDLQPPLTRAASVAWACPTCQDLAEAVIGWPMLLTLAAAGVELLDDGRDDSAVPHPERSAGGPPLTADDVLGLHELLDTDDWFNAVL